MAAVATSSPLDRDEQITEVETVPYQLFFNAETEEFFVPHDPLAVDKEWRALHAYSELTRDLEAAYYSLLESYDLYLGAKRNAQFCEVTPINLKINESLVNCQNILIRIAKFNEIQAQGEERKASRQSEQGGKSNQKVQQFSEFIHQKRLLNEQLQQAITLLDEERITFKNAWAKELQLDKDPTKFKDMLELMPVAIIDKNKGGNRSDNRFVYVRRTVISKDKFDKMHIRQLNESTYKSGSTSSGSDSFIIKDKHGNINYQFGKLANQLFSLKNAKIELKNNPLVAEKTIELFMINGSLFEWATQLEEAVKFNLQWDNASISLQTQFMRYTATASLTGKFDPIKKNMSFTANMGGVFTAFNGVLDGKIYIPNYLGQTIEFEAKKPSGELLETYPLGSLRLVLGSHLSGFVGASAYINSQNEFSTTIDDQTQQKQTLLTGYSAKKSNSNSIRALNKKMDNLEDGLKLEANLFIGATASVGIFNGELQWLKPISYYFSPEYIRQFTQKYDLDKMLSDNADSPTRQFETFAKLAFNIEAQAGLGAGFSLFCYLEPQNMKILIKVHAALCCGKGAKGDIFFYVDGKLIFTFVKWVLYQLLQANYTELPHIDSDLYYYLKDVVNGAYIASQEISSQLDELTEKESKMKQAKFLAEIASGSEKAAKNQLELAERIVLPSKHHSILYALPETKALFLAILTHRTTESESYQDHFATITGEKKQAEELRRVEKARYFHYYLRDAVLKILRTIQTKREWERVMKLFSLDPDIANKLVSGEVDVTEAEVKNNEKIIANFMFALAKYSIEDRPFIHDPKKYRFYDFENSVNELYDRMEQQGDDLILAINNGSLVSEIYDGLLDKAAQAHCIVENDSIYYQWQKSEEEQ